mmetsp:Transcript_4267/g.5797  ORF Transcript_4267/g.5797 Transcript_4267/m.5797 type:complete len:89 (-) Transcript_4267:1169-1435(-)
MLDNYLKLSCFLEYSVKKAKAGVGGRLAIAIVQWGKWAVFGPIAVWAIITEAVTVISIIRQEIFYVYYVFQNTTVVKLRYGDYMAYYS